MFNNMPEQALHTLESLTTRCYLILVTWPHVALCGQEGNRRFFIALATRYELRAYERETSGPTTLHWDCDTV